VPEDFISTKGPTSVKEKAIEAFADSGANPMQTIDATASKFKDLNILRVSIGMAFHHTLCEPLPM